MKGLFASALSGACEVSQAHLFKLNPLNSLSCRKMTSQRLRNLRLMTRRYLVSPVVGWLEAKKELKLESSVPISGQDLFH